MGGRIVRAVGQNAYALASVSRPRKTALDPPGLGGRNTTT
jgi:hypothetical protein